MNIVQPHAELRATGQHRCRARARGSWLLTGFLLATSVMAQTPSATSTSTSTTTTPSSANEQAPLKVLMIGNSLIYTNNLPGMLRSLARAQDTGPRIETASYLIPGADLQDHLRLGNALAALQAGHWDALVLQERGGLLACLDSLADRGEIECRNSVRAHKQFAEAAHAQNTRVILLGTWGPDTQWQERLDRGLKQMARETGAMPLYAGTRLRAYQADHRDVPMLSDGTHPTLRGSLLVAASLYRELSGRSAEAKPMLLDFPLLPVEIQLDGRQPLEANAALNSLAKPVVLAAGELPPLIQAAEPPP